ncbi:MAG: ParB/RepB/Spo0J family partition protein, partial [Candidatus Bathyarchaeota archaeon]|nr:ParB/RepB/Spo0J family partition protein [Candidatus Bathyarchaeota archaeon]
LVPIIVTGEIGEYQLVAGHRRVEAARVVGLQSIPAIVRDSDVAEAAEVTFAENFFRKDLSPVELACALSDCIINQQMTVKEMAAGFHRSEHWVQQMIAIAGWPGDVLEAIHCEAISVSAGANLAVVTDDKYRRFLVSNAVDSGATARTTSAWLQAWRAMQPPEQAVEAEPVTAGPVPIPMVPQAPCFCCSQMFKVNEMSHVPVCGACIQIIRQVGMPGG